MSPLSQRPWGPSAGNPTGVNINALNETDSPPSGPLPAVQAVAVSTEVAILNPALANNADPAMEGVLAVSIPPNSPTEKLEFDLFISGRITTAGNYTATLKLYGGAAPTGTPGSDTQVATSGAVTVNNTTEPFWLQLQLVYDSTSGKMRGQFKGQVGNTVVAATTLSNSPTGIENSNDPVASFYPTITFSGANAENTIEVDAFSIG